MEVELRFDADDHDTSHSPTAARTARDIFHGSDDPHSGRGGMRFSRGATVTVATTWITQRTQRAHIEWEESRRNREVLYGEFINEASRLTLEGLCNSLERPDTFVKLYGITGRIRLVATDVVLAAAEACIRQIVDLYSKPNMTVAQMRLAFEAEGLDPIKDFSVSCRKELFDLNARA